jgi:hypothetical protein
VPQIPYAPKHYVCYQAPTPITVDGQLDDAAWSAALWTEAFVDIEGASRPLPRFLTRAKMLWDQDYFYIAAELEEPHVWGTLTERDAVIYHDNDFELFIDPDGDTHEYYELEINALGTEWDLLLVRPYRDGAPAVNAWDITGLKTAVHVAGTLNDPTDTDTGWSVEIAIPWNVLAECAHRPAPPQSGDTWWVNFSRVQWRAEAVDGGYRKSIDPATGESYPEHNWVWSPQGLIAMHYPEMWGRVQFVDRVRGSETPVFVVADDRDARWALRRLYYAEREHERRYGSYTADLSQLGLDGLVTPNFDWPPAITASQTIFEARLLSRDSARVLSIRSDGRLTDGESGKR